MNTGSSWNRVGDLGSILVIAARSEARQQQVRTLGGVLSIGEPGGAALTGPRPGSCAAPHVPHVIALTGRLGTGPERTGHRRSPARSSLGRNPERDAHPTACAVVAGVACAYHGPISALPRQRFPPRPERVSPLSAPRFHPLTSTKTLLSFCAVASERADLARNHELPLRLEARILIVDDWRLHRRSMAIRPVYPFPPPPAPARSACPSRGTSSSRW